MRIHKFYTVIVFLLCLLISCSKDDSEPDTTFEGIWIMQARASRNCDNPEDNSSKNGDFISDTPCTDDPNFLCSHEKYVFEGGDFSKITNSVLLTFPISISTAGTYTLNGSILELCVEEGPVAKECSNTSMEIVGRTLILTALNPNTGCMDITFYLKQ